MNLPGKYNSTTATYVENKIEKDILIDSLKYLPKFLQDKAVMKDASALLDILISEENDVLKQIHEAYCDTLYKISAYQQLSYAAKTELLKEKGFGYLLDLLKYIYLDKYQNDLTENQRKAISFEDYLEQETSRNLANITMLFNLLYILKGKTLGLELALELVNCPDYFYLTWDIVANHKGTLNSVKDLPMPNGNNDVQAGDAYTIAVNDIEDAPTSDYIFNGVAWHQCTKWDEYAKRRQQFTADLIINRAAPELQAKIANFVRYYMLPYIEVRVQFTDSFEAVRAFPSGDISLLRCYKLEHYYDEEGTLHKHDLEHSVSQDTWKETGSQELKKFPITIGQPIFRNSGFQGKVDLTKSFIKSGDDIHYLYGQTKTIPNFITGPALESLTDEGTISFNNDYVQAPLQQDYVSVDIVTGDQINPYYKDEQFIRDTIIRYNTCLLVEGLHRNKIIKQMIDPDTHEEIEEGDNTEQTEDSNKIELLHIEDFDRYLDSEVYAGRITTVTPVNEADVIHFETSTPVIREKTGKEDTIHLKFSDAFVGNGYSGIGDLGILGANTYFIYNGMLFKNEDGIKQIDQDNTWTDVGASHAVSETYYTPAIKDGKLYYIKDDVIAEIKNDKTKPWTNVTGYVNEFYSAFAINGQELYMIQLAQVATDDNTQQVEYELQLELIDTGNWEYITGAFYSETYKAYGIKDEVLYTLDNVITEMTLDGNKLTGWDPSFDCISRYHHSNADYITYGICNGNLYAIQDETLTLLDNGKWTAVCGYYNDNSPRTFGYGIKDGALYELRGTQIEQKGTDTKWTDISGCTTTTNTFVLGICDGYLYKINSNKNVVKLDEENGYTEVFGRYTTSTSKNATCYGYAVKNGRLHVLGKEDITVPGMWKVDGQGLGVDLNDYNITNLIVRNGNDVITGIDNVRTHIPLNDLEDPSKYDIDVTYETIGFENNQRYEIKTEMSDVYETYIDPVTCKRDNVYLDNSPEFDTNTGLISNFTECPLIIHGKQMVNGRGDAYQFASERSYLEIPDYYDVTETEFETIKTKKPIKEAVFKIGCIVGKEMLPIILDKDGNTGIYYGYNNELLRSGIFAKTNDGWIKIVSVAENDNKDIYVKYSLQADNYAITYSIDGQNYKDPEENSIPTVVDNVEEPHFLGGDGNVYGDAIVFLVDSFITIDEKIPLYTMGKYFSVETLQQDLQERIVTHETQAGQKIIQIQDSNKNDIIRLFMNDMYVSRDFECSNEKLQIKDDFCFNKLNYGENEGVETSTIVYAGEFTLDPEKAKDVGRIKQISNYGKTAIANSFDEYNYIQISPEQELVIETGSEEINEKQTLFKTEEHEAYTNAYLLTSEISGNYNEQKLSDDTTTNRHVVPSGIIFEVDTDQPGTVTRNLEYNALQFEIDEEKVDGVNGDNFDDYTALLDIAGNDDYEDTFNINLALQETSRQESNKKITTHYDVDPILTINVADTYKQKIGQLGDEDIIIGNKERKYFDMEGNEIPNPYETDEDDENEDNENSDIIEDKEDSQDSPTVGDDADNTETQETIEFETRDIIDENAYAFKDDTTYKLKFDITREEIGINENLIKLIETKSTVQKDKFNFVDGTISNFSTENYIEIKNLTQEYGLVLQYTPDDDISKDQGLIGLENGQSVCIKDNRLCLCDNNGDIIEIANRHIFDEDTFYLYICNDVNEEATKLNNALVYITDDLEEEWEQLFENTIQITDKMFIGYCDTGVEAVPYNGSMDLTRSYTTDENGNIKRLYEFTQTTIIYAAETNNYEEVQTIITKYPVDVLQFGYAFNGTLDMYASNLLLPYKLEWLEIEREEGETKRTSIQDKIRQVLAEADKSYDGDRDTTEYTIKEYGVHSTIAPQRWDTISVTYKTDDNAYTMEPNTKYYLKCDVQLDENGKCILNKVGNTDWKSAVISNFENGHYTLDFTNEQYIVIHCTTAGIEDQGLCGYTDNNSQAIEIKDGKWQFFDDVNYHVICDAEPNKDYYFKLYMSSNYIEYKTEEWVKTDILAGFSGYDTFVFGKANGKTFNGSINLNDSFSITDDINYFFRLYKKITPYISKDGKNWHVLVLEPMLTLRDMISFGQGFSGSLHLDLSNLLLEDATYWTANQIKIYAKENMPEDGIAQNELVKTVLKDKIVFDKDKYFIEQETVKVNLEDIDLHVSGKPIVGDVITLTYNNWFLFRDVFHEYDFKITYGDRAVVSYVDVETEKEYVIYEMPVDNHLVNTGYNFWGTLSVKDSYRGGMRLCDYISWNQYIIKYRKYDEEEWTKWSEFAVENKYAIYQRTGFDLKGPLYMESSFVKLGNLISPFLAYWDGTYVTVVGGVNIEKGIASQFTQDDYLLIRDIDLKDGDIVSIIVQFTNLQDQGIASLVTLKDGYMYSTEPLQEVKLGYKACIEYHIKDGKAYARIIGRNTSNLQPRKSPHRTLTIIPYNKDLSDTNPRYYVKSQEDADKLKVMYRVGDTNYDHYTPPKLTWYEADLKKVDEIKYFGQVLKDVYVAKIDLGYDFDAAGNATNVNKNVEYPKNETVEYKIVSGDLTTYNNAALYKDLMFKQRTKF